MHYEDNGGQTLFRYHARHPRRPHADRLWRAYADYHRVSPEFTASICGCRNPRWASRAPRASALNKEKAILADGLFVFFLRDT